MLTALEPNAAGGTDHDFTLCTMCASESASRVCAVDAIRAACCVACCLAANRGALLIYESLALG